MEGLEQDGWEQLNKILLMAVFTANKYPDKTNFLRELGNNLPSLSARGFIKKDIMDKVCVELKKCRKAMGEELGTTESI